MAVEKNIAVQSDIALTLKQRLVGVLKKQVGVDRVSVSRAWSLDREMSNQHIRARSLTARSVFGLDETIAANDRHARTVCQTLDQRSCTLMFDLQKGPKVELPIKGTVVHAGEEKSE